MPNFWAFAFAAAAGLYGWSFLPADAGVWAYGAAVAAVILWAAAGAGRRLLRSGLRSASGLELSVLGAALGLGALSYSVFAFGLAGLLGRPLAVLVAAAGFWGWRDGKEAVSSAAAELAPCAGLLWPSGLLLAAAGWAAVVPPHQYDSLVYHLALAQGYLRQGALRPLPGIIYSGFVQNAELLFTLALGFGSDLAAQFLSAAATGLSAGLVWLQARRFLGERASALAVFLFLAHPAVLLLASTTYVEPWVGLWLMSAVHCFSRWDDEGALGWLAAAGLFSGLACGAKYYAVICPLILGLFLLGRRRSKALPEALVFAACAALPVLPWLAKNMYYIGNPVFPFLYKVFPGRDWSPSASAALMGDMKAGASAAGYFKVLAEYWHPLGFFKELALFPYQLLVQSLRFGGGMDVLGGLGWPGVLFAAALGAAAWGRSRRRDFVLLYLAGHFALWFATGVVLRFLVPVAGLFCAAAAGGVEHLWERAGAAGRALLAAGLAGFVLLGLYQACYVHVVLKSPEAMTGAKSAEEYLGAQLMYYPCARAAAGLAPNAKIASVGEQRSYYIGAEALPTSVFRKNLYQDLAVSATDAGALAGEFKKRGFTHLLYVPEELKRLEGFGVTQGLEGPAWAGLLKASPVVFQGPHCSLLAIP